MFSSGLVLEGGGLRAAYESGVTDAFIENNITFPYVIGVSAGSCNGVSFIAKNLHRMRDIMVNYAHDERYMGIKSIFKNGEYLNSKWIFGELSYEMFPLNYDEFENSKTKFCVVASNAKTGKAEYFYPTDFRKGCEIIHASCALPMVTKPVQIGKDMYYDGGICDSIPLKKAYEDGCEKCVVVLTQDRHFIKKPLGHEKAIRKAPELFFGRFLYFKWLCHRRWLMPFSLKFQGNNQQNASAMKSANRKTEGKGRIVTILWRWTNTSYGRTKANVTQRAILSEK